MRLGTLRFCVVLCSVFILTSPSQAQRKAPPDPARPKIRAITAFINLDRAQYQQQVADAMTMLKRARTVFESRDYEVQTIRISTQPFPEYTKGLTTEQALAFFKNYDALAEQQKFAASIGPAMLNPEDPESQADLLVDVLKNTKSINASLVVADENGVRWASVGAAARGIQKLAATEHSQGNFKFAAIAFVPPLTPFFPGSYHTGFGHQFAIALESANTVAAAFQGAPDLATARQRLIDRLGTEARNIQDLAGIPPHGDKSEQHLEIIIGDRASPAVKWHKPLSARLLPVTGKKAGDTTDFDDPYMVNTTLQPIAGKNQ